MAVTCASLEKLLSISRSRASTCACMWAWSSSLDPVIVFIASTSAGSVFLTMKSSPLSMNALTGACTPAPRRLLSTLRQLFDVMSGFCSEPDSANSFLITASVRMNHE